MKTILLCLTTGLLSLNLSAQTYDTLNFETPASVISIDSINGCWQIGDPQKTLFDSAYNQPHVIITDTSAAYPIGTESYFEVNLPVTAISAYYSLRFKHRFDTEFSKDGGYIQGYDCFSGTWMNIFDNMVMPCTFYGLMYNGTPPTTLLHNGEPGFTGTNSGWEEVEIYIPCMAVVRAGGSMEIKLRFVFVSDSIDTGQEGWMIDDLIFYDAGGWCSSMEENLVPSFSISPNPTNDFIIIQSADKMRIDKISFVNTQGQVLKTDMLTKNHTTEVSVKDLPSGLYFVLVNDKITAGKFIKE